MYCTEPNESYIKNATTKNPISVADLSSTDRFSLNTAFSTITAILLMVSILLSIGIVITTVLYCKEKKNVAKMSDSTPFREYTNQFDESLPRASQEESPATDIVITDITHTTPSMGAPPLYTPTNVVPQVKLSLKLKEAFYEDMASTGGSQQQQVVYSKGERYNVESMYVSQKQEASA